MAPLRLYNITSAFVPKSESIYMLGDNSTHEKPNPWPAALRVLHLLGMATDGEKHHRVTRHYTFRLAVSPQDDDVVKRLLTEQVASVAGESGTGSKVDVAEVAASFSAVMLAVRILVDGGDSDSSLSERLFSVPRETWHPNPVPQGRSAVGTSGPDGGYVLMHDLPKPVLEEYAVACVGIRTLPGSEDEESGTGAETKVCEIDRLYVDLEEDYSIAYVLVELMAEYARSSGYRNLRTAPDMEIGQAKGLFEKAGVAATRLIEASGTRLHVDHESNGQVAGIWELDLNKWSGPANGLFTE